MTSAIDQVKLAAYPPHFSAKDIETVLTPSESGKITKAFHEQQAWNIAMSPVKSMGMNLFMIWMMGSGAGIFAILMVGFALMQAARMAVNVSSAFKSCGDANVWMQKIVYLLVCGALLVYIGNHAVSMGLLPIHDADWLDHLPVTYVPRVVIPPKF